MELDWIPTVAEDEEIGNEIWDMGYGILDVGYDIRDVRCEI